MRPVVPCARATFSADANLDQLLDFAAAADEVTKVREAAVETKTRKRGKCSRVTIYDWSTHGVRGCKLRYQMVGAKRYTTRRWLGEFFEQLAAAPHKMPARLRRPLAASGR
jgi:hypothetical protein